MYRILIVEDDSGIASAVLPGLCCHLRPVRPSLGGSAVSNADLCPALAGLGKLVFSGHGGSTSGLPNWPDFSQNCWRMPCHLLTPRRTRIIRRLSAFVVEQVLSNALKHTLFGGIAIALEGESTLCIRDTGIGIAPENLPRTFEKGFTGCNGGLDKRAGVIGLYLCRNLTKLKESEAAAFYTVVYKVTSEIYYDIVSTR